MVRARRQRIAVLPESSLRKITEMWGSADIGAEMLIKVRWNCQGAKLHTTSDKKTQFHRVNLLGVAGLGGLCWICAHHTAEANGPFGTDGCNAAKFGIAVTAALLRFFRFLLKRFLGD